MVRPKLVKNGASGAGHLSGIVVVVCLILGWSRPAFSVEPIADPDEQQHLQLAPINLSHSVGGNIGYVFQRNTSGGNKTMQQTLGVGVEAGIGVRSFFWQPWLAQVSSHLTAGVNGTSTNSNTTPTYNSVGTAINADAALNLLRSSRFPFEARIFRQDNKYTAFYSGTNIASQITGYSLIQSYRSRNDRLTGNASFVSNKYGGLNISPSYADIFSFALAVRPTRTQSISISGNTDSANRPVQGQSSLRDTLIANHAYQPNSIFSVASIANLLKMSYRIQGSGPTQQYDANSLQFSSFASLRPEKSPLTMTSSVRFLKSDSSSNGILAPTLTSSNFNLGANYLFSPFIRMYGSVNVADTLGTQTVSTDAALSAAKPYRAATATDIGGFRYSGSIGGNLSTNSTTSTNSANQTTTRNNLNLGLYLSHALDKSSEFGAGRLSENMHQTVAMGVNGRGGSSISNLISGGSLSWNRTEGKETTILRLSATDSRNLRGTQNVFQIINLQATRREALSRNESLGGSLTVQATHAQVSGITTPSTLTPSAEMVYQNQRLFKVLHLTFESSLRIAEGNIAPREYLGYQDQATRSWDNNFTYYIGRLNLRLTTNMSKLGNTFRSSIIFMMNRPF